MSNELKVLGRIYLLCVVWLLANVFCKISLTVCPTKLIWNIPCLGCGLTRAFSLLLHGRIADAIIMNPNILIAAPAAIVFPFVYISYFYLGNMGFKFSCKHIHKHLKVVLLTVFFFAEACIWAYNIYRGI